MFKFNFNEETTPEKFEEKPTDLATEYKESKLVDVDYTETADHVRNSKVNCFVSNEHEVGYLDNGTFTGTTDLIPRVYEGGFKIWECTQDLADLITSLDENVFSEKNVCDLGCSAGILGIIALAFGAKHIDFQDYNEDVLEAFTIPNVVLNCEENEHPEDFLRCKFYSGDWDSFKGLTQNQEKYDVIVTSETIYNPDNYKKLLNFFKTRLTIGGKVYLSAKSYYFGVSGNILDFCKLMDEEKALSYETLWKSVDGVQREILLIKLNL